VSAQAGLTKGFLSRLERDEVSPSVASLVSCVGVLGIGVGHCSSRPDLAGAGAEHRHQLGGAACGSPAHGGSQRNLQVIRSVVEPGGGGGEELYALACEVEFVHVLHGELRLLLPGEEVDLHEGDAFTMPGATPHTWLNPSATTTCEVLWALTPAP
jgi:quercetin dioxygenase-like cupin family protein